MNEGRFSPSPLTLTLSPEGEGTVRALFTVILYQDYFLRAYFRESSATAKMMMPPLMMYCQYGFTPM